MTNHTAIVETLTAEVRVLMVGSRQVTMSVYGQLDWINPDEIETFGRVRPRDARFDYIYLIGRNRENGSLARSSAPGGESSIKEELGWSDYARSIRSAEIDARRAAEEAERDEKWEAQTHGISYHRCDVEKIAACHVKETQATAKAEKLRREFEEKATPLREQARELAALPLIVLAGLR